MGNFLKLFFVFSFLISIDKGFGQVLTPVYEARHDIPAKYTHKADINFIFLKSWDQERKKLPDIMQRLQNSFDKCNIFINVKAHYNVSDYETLDFNLEEWETFWFNSDELSGWENLIFSKNLPKGNNIFFVDSINFTIEGQGTLGIAYPEYLLDHFEIGGHEGQQFYRKHMLGNAVIGLYRARWTLAHELGHAIMNLEHTDGTSDNIMWSGVDSYTPEFEDYILISSRNPVFNQTQCEQGYKSPFVTTINK